MQISCVALKEIVNRIINKFCKIYYKIMWKHRQARDYFCSETINDVKRDCISKKTLKELLDRLAAAETWLLKHLLGDSYAIRAAAVNVRVNTRKNGADSETFFGDLYVIQNLKNQKISFKLYSPKENQFTWAVDDLSDLDGYMGLKCNTHILLSGNSIHTFKFPDKKERTLFIDNLNKFLFFEKSKSKKKYDLRL